MLWPQSPAKKKSNWVRMHNELAPKIEKELKIKIIDTLVPGGKVVKKGKKKGLPVDEWPLSRTSDAVAEFLQE